MDNDLRVIAKFLGVLILLGLIAFCGLDMMQSAGDARLAD